jgi:hypothetical protein
MIIGYKLIQNTETGEVIVELVIQNEEEEHTIGFTEEMFLQFSLTTTMFAMEVAKDRQKRKIKEKKEIKELEKLINGGS